MQIGNYDTNIWGAVAEYSIAPPEPIKHFITIAGRNGSIDASRALTGYPTYNDRIIKVTLLVVDKTAAQFQAVYDDIYAKVHGRRLNGVFPEDSSYYYVGLWEITDINHESKNVRTIELECQAEPYAYKSTMTTKSLSSGTVEISSNMPTQMTLVVTSTLVGSRGSSSFTYSAGTYTLYPLLVGEETWTITSGTGTLTYREGKL